MDTPKTPIDLYEALARMKEISAAGGTFAMKYRKWNREKRAGGDLVTVKAARMRPKAADEKIENSSYKLFYTDTETGLARNCWQMLVVEFEGRPTVLT